MLRWILIFNFSLFCSLVYGQQLGVSITHASYQTEEKSYTEFFFHIVGNSVTYDTLGSTISGGVMNTFFVYEGDSLVFGNRLLLKSPDREMSRSMDSTLDSSSDFVHMERLILLPGEYQIRFELNDASDSTNSLEVIYPIEVSEIEHDASLSDIRLLASFKKSSEESTVTKNGVYLEPLPFNFYHREHEALSAYLEAYNLVTSDQGNAIIRYSIQKFKAGDNDVLLERYKKLEQNTVVPILLTMPIHDLPSDNYLFVVELINEEKQVLKESLIPFRRSNPEKDLIQASANSLGYTYLDSLDTDRLDYYLKSLVPVVAYFDIESIDYLLRQGKDEHKKTFIYRHFEGNYGGQGPQAFGQYAEVVRAIDKMFNDGFGYGFESDRGRAYLKYGKPSDRINVQDDEGAFPYEIWFYNEMLVTNQRDIRFMFYNPDYTGNRYLLLTTTCRGERQNRQWELELYRNAPADIQDNRIDASRVRTDYRRRARQLYTD